MHGVYNVKSVKYVILQLTYFTVKLQDARIISAILTEQNIDSTKQYVKKDTNKYQKQHLFLRNPIIVTCFSSY
jgi:hypothetical protein